MHWNQGTLVCDCNECSVIARIHNGSAVVAGRAQYAHFAAEVPSKPCERISIGFKAACEGFIKIPKHCNIDVVPIDRACRWTGPLCKLGEAQVLGLCD